MKVRHRIFRDLRGVIVSPATELQKMRAEMGYCLVRTEGGDLASIRPDNLIFERRVNNAKKKQKL